MRKDRFVRISFIFCAALVIVAFWAGYYFGNTDPDTASHAAEDTSDLYIESEADASETMTNTAKTSQQQTAASGKDRADEEPDENGINTEESTVGSSEDTYCLRRNGSYLSVYRGTSDEVYFETGMRVSDLPGEIQQDAEEGIFFDSLEELYGFLENYSS